MRLAHRSSRSTASWHDARGAAYAAADATPAERIRLETAEGRVLAEPLRGLVASPAFDTAAMDGYAVVGPGPWRVLSGVRADAGHSWPGVLASGEALSISTGAVVPAGAERVLPTEATVSENELLFAGDLPARSHVRRAGEEALQGEILLPAGTRMRAAALGLAAASGHDDVAVHRRPVVAAVVTGDELVTQGLPKPGEVRDAIGPMLAGLVTAFGGVYAGAVRRGDDRSLDLSRATADVVVVTGSTSRGTTDRLRRLLARDDYVVDGVACRPGHPMLLARRPDTPWIVGLPGNPFAALVAVHTLLGPLLAGLGGGELPRLPRARVVGGPTGQGTRVVPVRWTSDGDVRAGDPKGSAYLGPAAAADGLAVVVPGEELSAVLPAI